MGGKWTVEAWVPDHYREGGYTWEERYRGPSLGAAVRALVLAKMREKAGCVRLEWR